MAFERLNHLESAELAAEFLICWNRRGTGPELIREGSLEPSAEGCEPPELLRPQGPPIQIRAAKHYSITVRD